MKQRSSEMAVDLDVDSQGRDFFMPPLAGTTFDENDGQTRTPSLSPPYALRKGE